MLPASTELHLIENSAWTLICFQDFAFKRYGERFTTQLNAECTNMPLLKRKFALRVVELQLTLAMRLRYTPLAATVKVMLLPCFLLQPRLAAVHLRNIFYPWKHQYLYSMLWGRCPDFGIRAWFALFPFRHEVGHYASCRVTTMDRPEANPSRLDSRNHRQVAFSTQVATGRSTSLSAWPKWPLGAHQISRQLRPVNNMRRKPLTWRTMPHCRFTT